MIWLVFATLTIATLAALLFPLLRPRADVVAARADYDVAVYRDQLTELEHDIERGLITGEQANTARLEIQRRMLAAEHIPPSPSRGSAVKGTPIIALIIALFLPLGSWLLYGYLGSPELPDRPFAARQNDPDFHLNAAAEKMEAALESRPDAEGYRHVAGIFAALHRFDRAAEACRKAIDHGADDAGIWSQLGENLVMANDGAVVMDALGAFKTALAHDASDPRARFYAGLAETEIGNLKKAVAIWRDLEKDAPPDAPWLHMVKENIALYAKQGGFDPSSIQPAPPALR